MSNKSKTKQENYESIFDNKKAYRAPLPKLIIYTLSIILTIIYIVFRIGFTLPYKIGWVEMIFSLIVLFVEIWEFFDFFVYYFNILCFKKRVPKAPNFKDIEEYPDIDIMIATIDEYNELLEKNITACKNLNYPDKSKLHIYLCDDGNRKDVKELADNMGINYISRLTHKDAKAGNYNHALTKMNSPYVATFDADMIPEPDFLEKTLPYFYDKKANIGFVQQPQSFKNPDIFQLRFGLSNKLPFEQEYFYHSIQLAKNATNSAIFCGTNALFLREALDAAGGFATGTISEDIATGMMVESKGYRGLATNDISVYGTATDDLTSYAKQRSRWARGCIQIFKKFDIVNNKGLTFRQKIEYLSCVSYWFYGLKRMIYLLTPLLFSLFGLIIVDCDLTTFIAIWLPGYILKRYFLDFLEGNKRSSTWNKIYETTMAPIMWKAVLKEFIGFGSTKFEVTPKYNTTYKMTKTNFKLLLSHLLLLGLSIAGLVMCLIRLKYVGLTVYILSLVWLISNIFYLSVAVIFDLRFKPIAYKNFKPNKVKRYGYSTIPLIFLQFYKKRIKN